MLIEYTEWAIANNAQANVKWILNEKTMKISEVNEKAKGEMILNYTRSHMLIQ